MAVRDKERQDNAEYADLVNRNIAVAESHRGVDGGMNPVFLAQLNSSGMFDPRSGAPIATTAPGTLPRTPNQPPAQVVPPVQPVQVATAAEEPVGIAANVPVPRSAPQAKDASTPAQTTGLASLIDSIFGGNKVEAPAPVAQPAARPARSSRTAVAQSKPAAKPAMRTAAAPPAKPKAKPSRVATATPVPELRPAVKAEASAQPRPPASEMRTAFSAPPPNKSGLLTGAQPVLPAGNFESRWSAFR